MIAEPLGGAFGGKFALVEPLAVGAALALQRPVPACSRAARTSPPPTRPRRRSRTRWVGARADGTLTAIEARMIVDRGTNADAGASRAGRRCSSPGRIAGRPTTCAATACRSNRFTFGAYRAPGAPTAAYALESPSTSWRRSSNSTSIALRLKNAVVEGDVGVSGSPFPTIGAVEVLERLREHPLWAQRDSLPDGEGGMAAGHWPGAMEPASVVCRVDADGTMTVVTSVADMSGVNSGFAVIAAAAFGLSPDQVRVVTADTASALYAGASGGSKITYTVGPAVLRAAEAARERLPPPAGAGDRAGRPRGGRRRRGRGRARPLDHGAGSSVEGAPLRRAL